MTGQRTRLTRSQRLDRKIEKSLGTVAMPGDLLFEDHRSFVSVVLTATIGDVACETLFLDFHNPEHGDRLRCRAVNDVTYLYSTHAEIIRL